MLYFLSENRCVCVINHGYMYQLNVLSEHKILSVLMLTDGSIYCLLPFACVLEVCLIIFFSVIIYFSLTFPFVLVIHH